MQRAEINEGVRPGTTTEEHAQVVALERENRELRRANAILKAASAFFAAELDPHRSDDPVKVRLVVGSCKIRADFDSSTVYRGPRGLPPVWLTP